MSTNNPPYGFSIYDLGQDIRSEAVFVSAGGVQIDPSSVMLSVRDPDGTVTTYTYGTDPEIVRIAVGRYYADIDASASGDYYTRWHSTGTGQAATERRFRVRAAKAIAT